MHGKSSLLSVSKKRIRDGWVDVKDLPYLRGDSDDDDDGKAAQSRLKPESAVSFTGKAMERRKQRIAADMRQDGNCGRDLGHGESQRRLDTITGGTRNSAQIQSDEIGFEVEMEKSPLTNRDGTNMSSSASRSVFSISSISYSEMSHNNNGGRAERSQRNAPTTPGSKARGRLASSMSRNRRKPVFIDVDMEDTNSPSNVKDKTPKANNRSKAQTTLQRRPMRRSLIPKITDSAQKYRKQNLDADSTGSTHPSLEDSPGKSSASPETHPSLEDTGGYKSTIPPAYPSIEDASIPQSHPSLEDTTPLTPIIDRLSHVFLPQLRIRNREQANFAPTSNQRETEVTDRLSPITHPSLEDRTFNCRSPDTNGNHEGDSDSPGSESSEEVESRWDRLREKLLAVDTSSPTSQEVNHYWERQREKMHALSPRSLSEDIKDDLIQDCIDTGMPSPTNEHETRLPSLAASGTGSVSRPQHSVASAISSPGIRRAQSSEFPSKIPISARKAAKKNQSTQSDSEGGESSSRSLEFENKCLRETKIDTVNSGLTAEFDGGADSIKLKGASASICSISDIEVEEAIKNFSSCSESKEIESSSPALDRAISSASGSYHTCSGHKEELVANHSVPGGNRESFSPNILSSPNKPIFKSPEDDKDINVPRIEVTLLPNTTLDYLGSNNSPNVTGLQDKNGCKIKSPNTSLFNVSDSNTIDSTIDSKSRKQQQNSTIRELDKKDPSGASDAPSGGRRNQPQVKNSSQQTTTAVPDKMSKSSLAYLNGQTTAQGESRINNALCGKKEDVTQASVENIDFNLKCQQQDAKRIIITGRKKLMDAKNSEQQNQEGAESIEDETAIIDVASTLTQETFSTHQRTTTPSVVTSTPVLRKSSKAALHDDTSHSTNDLSIAFKNAKSFDTKLTASTDGIPSWRLDPSRSLADFKLQILNQGNGEIATYHIHKHMVAIGPRRSEYLDTLFRSNKLPSTQLTMEEKPANLFPILLDYMYCHDAEVQVTTETALAYRKVALTFKVIPLLVKAAGFILEDVKIGTIGKYVEQATRYRDQTILKLVVARCAENIDKFRPNDPMWAVMEPDTFLQVLSSSAIDREKMSDHLSILVTEYQTTHKYELDGEKFRMLTAESILPTIDRLAALPLLEICEEYGCDQDFQQLQERCAHVMACYWKITGEGDRKRVFALLRSLPSSFTVDFLETIEIGKSATLVNALKASRSSIAQPETSDTSTITFSLASLCDDLAGEDGYSVSSNDDAPLDWRQDPKLTYSDWKIKVKHHGMDRSDIYNVHKHILSIGYHKSNFFADLFLAEEHTNTRRGMTTMELAPAAAVLVPTMLDFIYAPKYPLKVTNNTSGALRFLARVFGVWMLNKELLEFVHKDMNLDNVLQYINEAETFGDEKVTTMALRFCAKKIQHIKVDSPLLTELKPDIFGRLVSSSEIGKDHKCHVSILIAKYFTLHDLSEELLGQLLQVSKMSEIDATSALQLLRIVDSLKSKEMEIFKTLRKRCAQVITENWNELRENHREEMFELFRQLDPSIIVDMFDWVESFYHQQQSETMTLQVKLVKRYRKQLADARVLREADISQLQLEKDQKIAELMAANEELEAKLRNQGEASTRRAVRCTEAYRAPTPTPPTIPIPNDMPSSRDTVMTSLGNKGETAEAGKPKPRPAATQKTPAVSKSKATPKPSIAKSKQQENDEPVPYENLAEARQAAMKNIAPDAQNSSIFNFSLFACPSPGPQPTGTPL